MNGREVEILLHTGLRGSTKDHLRDVMVAHETCDFFGYSLALQSDHLRPQVLCESDIFGQRSLVFGPRIASDIDVYHVEIAADRLRHSRTARNQVLSCRIGADTHGNPFPHSRGLFDTLPGKERIQAAVDDLCDLPKGKFP